MTSNTNLISAYISSCNNENNHMIDLFNNVSTEGEKSSVLIGLLFMILRKNTVVFYKNEKSRIAFKTLEGIEEMRLGMLTNIVKPSILKNDQPLWDWIINNKVVLIDFFLNDNYDPPSYRRDYLTDIMDTFCTKMLGSDPIIISIDKLRFLNEFCVKYGDDTAKQQLLNYLKNKTIQVVYSDINQVTGIPDIDVYLRNLLTGIKNEIVSKDMEVDDDSDPGSGAPMKNNSQNEETTTQNKRNIESTKVTPPSAAPKQSSGFGNGVQLEAKPKGILNGPRKGFNKSRNSNLFELRSRNEQNVQTTPENRITQQTEEVEVEPPEEIRLEENTAGNSDNVEELSIPESEDDATSSDLDNYMDPDPEEEEKNPETIVSSEEQTPKPKIYGEFLLREYEDQQIKKEETPTKIYTETLNDFSDWLRNQITEGEIIEEFQKMAVFGFLSDITKDADVKNNLARCMRILNGEETTVLYEIVKNLLLNDFKKKFIEIFISTIVQKLKEIKIKPLSIPEIKLYTQFINKSEIEKIDRSIILRISTNKT